MKICVVTQWFPPEHAPIGFMLHELAEELGRQGHHVTVVTGFPNHPGGVVFPGYQKRWLHEETVDGVRILRTWLFTSASRSLLSRVLTYLTFTATSSWTLLLRARPDLIFAVFQPLSVGLTLPIVAALTGARLVLNIQDLHPDALISAGLLRNRVLIALLRRLERFGYRHARALVVIAPSFRDHVIAQGVSPARVAVIENWIDTDAIGPADRDNAIRAELGASRDTFLVLYAGTIGHVSGADVVIDAAMLLRDEPSIEMAFVGEGPLLPALKARAASARLGNVAFLPFQPRHRLSQVQACCDVAVVSLGPGLGRSSVPSKVLGYMAAARPVIASVDADTETARLIQGAGCGVVVPSADPQALAAVIRSLRDDRPRLERLGQSGREFVVRHYSRASSTRRYAEFLSTVS